MSILNTRTLIIMPCHNESGRVGKVVTAVRALVPGADVAVIDDASSDGSRDEAREAGATVLPLGCQLGYGAALETGYLYALQSGYERLVQMDSDGQHPPDQVPLLLARLDETGADVVMGSRHLGGVPTDILSQTPWVRRLGQRVFSLALRITARRRFSDPTSGFRALNRRALALLASGCFPCDYPDSDVLLMLVMAGLRIEETPVKMLAREGGTSMHGGIIKPLYYSIHMVFAMFIVVLNRQHWFRWNREHWNGKDV